jgi:hypothetical protein
MSFRWSTPPRTAWGDLSAAYVLAIRNGVRAIAQRRAPEIEAWMKENAPWTDRTGNARQTLSAEVEDATLDMVSILLAGGVEYQIFLELAHGGNWAIIAPAVDYWGPILWADVRAMLR